MFSYISTQSDFRLFHSNFMEKAYGQKVMNTLLEQGSFIEKTTCILLKTLMSYGGWCINVGAKTDVLCPLFMSPALLHNGASW